MFRRIIFYILAVLFSTNTFASRGLTSSEYEQYFPQALQSWKGADSRVSFENSMQVLGFTDEYIANNQAVYNDGSGDVPVVLLGFDSVGSAGYQTAHAASCGDGFGCAVDSDVVSPRSTPDAIEARKAPTPVLITPPASLPTASLSVSNSDTPCSDTSLCHAETVDGVVDLYIDADLASLDISVYGGALPLNIIISGQRYIGNIAFQSNGNTTLVFEDDLELTTDTMVWGNGAVITAGSNVLFKVITSFSTSSAPKLTTTNPIFYYAPTGSISISATSGGDYYGCLLADNIILNNKLTINGAITARVFDDSTGSTITGNGSCVASIPDPEPPVTPDICTLFPDGIQGNYYSDGKPTNNALDVIEGSGGKGNRLYLDSRDPISFNSQQSGSTTSTNSGCIYAIDSSGNSTSFDTAEPENCIIDGSEVKFDGSPYIPEDFSDGSGDVVVDKFHAADQNNITPVNIDPGKYNSLTVGVDGTAILNPGEYWFSTINLGDGGENGQIKLSADASQENPVIVHYKKVNFNGSGVYINSNAGPDRKNTAADTPDTVQDGDSSALWFIGHGADSSVHPTVNDIYINAGWYISPEAEAPGFDIEGANRFQMIGAVTAPGVKMYGTADYTYFYPQDIGGCSTPTPDETYTIEVTPDEGYYLSCDAPNITFTVRDENGDIATDYAGNINATFPNGLVPDNANIIQGKVIDADNNVYQPVDGQVVVPVSSGEYKAYEVEGELADDATQKDTGNIEFVPFAFYVDDQHVIANKPQSVEVKALACDSDTHDKVAVNYTGTPEVTQNLVEPKDGVGELTFSPEFTDKEEGQVSTDLTFTDSGKVSVTLEDKDFDCTGYEGCPIGDGQSDGEMKGVFTVYSRPWTFAICDAGGSNMDGNITDSASLGYKAAGQEFNLHIKPLRWVSGETDPVAGSENIDVSDLCNKAMTQNYFSSSSPDSTIQLSYELAQPSSDIGTEGSLSGPQSLLNTEGAGNGSDGYYDFAKMSWSEVGVLKIKMDTAENYYDMNINQGYRDIGRFYPDHLAIFENTWKYAEGHSSFAYMNQPIGMTYTVEARSANDNPTQNYGYFSESLQAKLQVVGADTNKNNMSLANRFYAGDAGTDVGWSSVSPVSDRNAQYVYSTDNFEFFKQSVSTAPYVSSPDGPFDGDSSNWGMEVTDSTVDEVNFEFNNDDNSFTVDTLNERAMAFSNQPDFRYGRMVLDSVSSPIGGPVSIPLRTEFWDGESYVVNEDDSGSQFKTSVYCAVDEDTGDASGSALLTDTDNDKLSHSVNEGKTSIVQAKQSDAKRETARIFLRQGSDNSSFHNSNPQPAGVDCEWNNSESINQPWLQFNWRDKGDEDPSTVVTFGAYRGNDRIIFRGEEQLTE